MKKADAFNPRTDTMMHFIHDSLFGVGGLEDLVAHEMPFPKCAEVHDADKHLGRWACDAAEWVLVAAIKHPEIMAALNERASYHNALHPDPIDVRLWNHVGKSEDR